LPNSFGYRLEQAFRANGQLCVGIDPHQALLEDWGLPDSADGLLSFGRTVVQAATGRVGIVKPQVSFFERHGSRGFAVLEQITHEAKDAGLLVIADAKRGDIGTTMTAYLEAWLGRGSALFADALTVSPYLGAGVYIDQFTPYLERGKGLFSLVATSNPEGLSVQQSVAAGQWAALSSANSVTAGPGESLGSFGAVVGATIATQDFGFTLDSGQNPLTPILAPGFGAQGARLADIKRIFGAYSTAVVASVSRSVLEAGPLGIESAIDSHNLELAKALS
jgi:orotidine-5'-phosphate decarboxylase